MKIVKFLQEVMVIIERAFSKSPQLNKEPGIKLTAMSYSKQADLFELNDVADPQCKCPPKGADSVCCRGGYLIKFHFSVTQIGKN